MKKTLVICITLFLVSLMYRGRGLMNSYPFWVDEFSTAYQSNLVLQHGLGVFHRTDFERHNITTHFSIALSYALFGKSEQTTRLPLLLFGSLVPVMVYLLCQEIWKNKYISIPAALLTVFSYLQITWSLQARGYVIQQFFLLLSLILSLKIFGVEKPSLSLKLTFCLVLLLGFLTHLSFILVILFYGITFIYKNKKQFITKSVFLYAGVVGIVLILLLGKIGKLILSYLEQLLHVGLPNNFWYYHSFLWRQYPILTLMSVFALFLLLKSKQKYLIFIFTALPSFYLLFYCFISRPYSSRYLLPIFPLFFILSAYFLFKFGETFFKVKILGTLLVLFIVINGDKFVSKPKSYYSVNHDMREISNIDYNQVYALIKEKSKNSSEKIAVIDTWHDRARWYLGSDYDGLYFFTWLDTDQFSNGMALKTNYQVNDQKEKYIESLENFKVVGELSDLTKVMEQYRKGFIWIDDTALPEDVINYVKTHFYKELYLDHYTLDDNPYSIWPGTLYSWGFDE